MKKTLAMLAAFFLMIGSLMAVEAEVVNYDPAKKIVTVKVDGKERKIALVKGEPHVHDVDGKLLNSKEIEAALKPGVRVELEEKNGKVVEIEIIAEKKKN